MQDAVKDCLPANVAAHRAGITRDRLIRRIQVGEVEGALIGGKWFADARSLAEFIARGGSRSRLPVASNAGG